MQVDVLEIEVVRDCLRVAAKRAAIKCIQALQAKAPDVVVDKWVKQLVERQAFVLLCKKHGVSADE